MITAPPARAISDTVSTLSIALKPAQPLWRFALVGLGPLTAMLIFALVLEAARRV